jgi:hypothetical protein
MSLALPFIFLALMMGAQGTAVKDAPWQSEVDKKAIQAKQRQVAEATGCEDYKADFDMDAVCKKEGCLSAEAVTAVLRTGRWIRILPAPPCHRNRRVKKALAVLRAGVSALLAGTLPPSTTQP